MQQVTSRKQGQKHQQKSELLGSLSDDVKDITFLRHTITDNADMGKDDPSNEGDCGTDGWERVTNRKHNRKQKPKHIK